MTDTGSITTPTKRGRDAPGVAHPGPRATGAPRKRGRSEGLIVVGDAERNAPPRGVRTARVAGAALVVGDLAGLLVALALFRTSGRLGVLYVALAVCVLAAASAYRLRITLGALDEAPRLAALLAIPLLLVAPFAARSPRHLLLQALASAGTVVLARAGVYTALRAARRRGFTERTIIAGSGHVGIELAQLTRSHPEYGLDVVGFVGAPFPNLPAPLLGDIAHLDDVVTRNDIRRVLVAFGPTRESELVGVLRTAVLRDVEVHVVPRFFEVGVAPRGPDVDDIWGIPVYRVRQAALRARAWRFKRALDITLSSVGIILAAPVMAGAAIAIKVSSPGPVLFRQRRIGQHGREFEVLKFRTLPAGHIDNHWNASGSEYRTLVGRVLRRLSIDELPQLWNVLLGDMSLVGPRPERGYLVEQFNTSVYGYSDRHRLPVGLTGWAQVHGLRGETSLRERARFDNQYIEHWSMWRDIVILMRTASAFFRATPDADDANDEDPLLRDAPSSATPETEGVTNEAPTNRAGGGRA